MTTDRTYFAAISTFATLLRSSRRRITCCAPCRSSVDVRGAGNIMQPIHGQCLATVAPRPAHVRHHTGPSYARSAPRTSRQAGRDQPLQRHTSALQGLRQHFHPSRSDRSTWRSSAEIGSGLIAGLPSERSRPWAGQSADRSPPPRRREPPRAPGRLPAPRSRHLGRGVPATRAQAEPGVPVLPQVSSGTTVPPAPAALVAAQNPNKYRALSVRHQGHEIAPVGCYLRGFAAAHIESSVDLP